MIYLICYVIGGIIFGLITSYLAHCKGYDGGFAWGFFLGAIGLMVVGFRPNLAPDTSTYSENTRSIEPIASSDSRYPYQTKPAGWMCECGARNPHSLDYCLSCRRPRTAPEPIVDCSHCGAKNKMSNKTCFACGNVMSNEVVKPEKPGVVEPREPKRFSEILEELADLHSKGILTDEEYTTKKTEILKNL